MRARSQSASRLIRDSLSANMKAVLLAATGKVVLAAVLLRFID